jgi:hypothetical protein
MSGGAFILLKDGRFGPKTAKQTEIHLANLLKILSIGALAGRKGPAMVIFAWILPDMANCAESAKAVI